MKLKISGLYGKEIPCPDCKFREYVSDNTVTNITRTNVDYVFVQYECSCGLSFSHKYIKNDDTVLSNSVFNNAVLNFKKQIKIL